MRRSCPTTCSSCIMLQAKCAGEQGQRTKRGAKGTSAHLTQVANSCLDTWQVTDHGRDGCVLNSVPAAVPWGSPLLALPSGGGGDRNA